MTLGPRLGIFGSCVSRDTVAAAREGTFDLQFYIARQSISRHSSGPIDGPVSFPGLSSAFQRRMVFGDVRANIHQTLRSHRRRLDIVLLDLIDERHGLVEFPSGERLTHSAELSRSGYLEDHPPTRQIAFGTQEHFDLFREGAERVVATLRQTSLLSRTVVIDAPYARSVQGVADHGDIEDLCRRADRANANYPRYIKVLEACGLPVITADPATHAADPDHRWGLAPFHYTADFYASLIERIQERTDSAHHI